MSLNRFPRKFAMNDLPESACSFQLHNIRTNEALARFGGDEARLKHWLLDFMTYGTQARANIETAIGGGSQETAVSTIHAFKGRAGMLGMVELHSIAQSLEQCLRNGEPGEIWLDELTRTLSETQAEIGAVLGSE
jgi:HPt (histidine-containing phosphotransfer) domain-containing protein